MIDERLQQINKEASLFCNRHQSMLYEYGKLN
uniref:Uncharacterized protein n=1 Tax=Arundo donax TaxID=35708 RepID=A0A0A8XUS9_ARUDO